MSNCYDTFTLQACFVPDDKTQVEIALNKVVRVDGKGSSPAFIYYQSSDTNMTPLADLNNVNGMSGVIEDRPCRVDLKAYKECWAEDADVSNTKVLYAVYNTAVYPVVLKEYLEEDRITVADVTGWSKTDFCDCK